MTVRYLKPTDLHALAAIDKEPDLLPKLDDPMTEAAVVVLDDDFQPIMACVAVRTVQVYLVASKAETPFTGSKALRLLSDTMAKVLKAKHYSEAVAFVSDPRFGNFLEARLGWLPTKLAWMRRF